jgi:protein transport protein DSL1/ZW10
MGLTSLKTGLINSLVDQLSAHAALAQKAADAEVLLKALTHLNLCRRQYDTLVKLTNEGNLAEAVKIVRDLEGSLKEAPSPLPRAAVFAELQVCPLFHPLQHLFSQK